MREVSPGAPQVVLEAPPASCDLQEDECLRERASSMLAMHARSVPRTGDRSRYANHWPRCDAAQ